jgi:hypothetical protein
MSYADYEGKCNFKPKKFACSACLGGKGRWKEIEDINLAAESKRVGAEMFSLSDTQIP